MEQRKKWGRIFQIKKQAPQNPTSQLRKMKIGQKKSEKKFSRMKKRVVYVKMFSEERSA